MGFLDPVNKFCFINRAIKGVSCREDSPGNKREKHEIANDKENDSIKGINKGVEGLYVDGCKEEISYPNKDCKECPLVASWEMQVVF